MIWGDYAAGRVCQQVLVIPLEVINYSEIRAVMLTRMSISPISDVKKTPRIKRLGFFSNENTQVLYLNAFCLMLFIIL